MVKDEATTRYHRTVAQIEGVKQANRTDKILGIADELVLDIATDNFDPSLRSKDTDLIFLGKTVGEFCPVSDFKLRITVEIERKRTQSNLQFHVAFEKMRIVPQNFALIAAFGNLDRCEQWPAIAKQISVGKAHPENCAGVGPIAYRKTEFLGFGFFSGNIEPQIIVAHRLWINLKDIKEAGAHQFAEFFVEYVRAVVFSFE